MASVVEHRMVQRTPAMARLATQSPKNRPDWLVRLIEAMDDVAASSRPCESTITTAFRNRLDLQEPNAPKSEKLTG
jgi:hypothetical protein